MVGHLLGTAENLHVAKAKEAPNRDTSFAARAGGLINFVFMSNGRWDEGGSTL